MLERAANGISGVFVPISRWLSYVGAVALILIVLLTVAEIFARRFLNSPISGVLELTSLGLVIFVFLTLAYCASRGGHIVLDILVNRFPKRLRAATDIVISALTTGMLGVAAWQLWVLALRIQRSGQTMSSHEVPIYPFIYVAALGGALLAIIYLVYLLYAIAEARK